MLARYVTDGGGPELEEVARDQVTGVVLVRVLSGRPSQALCSNLRERKRAIPSKALVLPTLGDVRALPSHVLHHHPLKPSLQWMEQIR